MKETDKDKGTATRTLGSNGSSKPGAKLLGELNRLFGRETSNTSVRVCGMLLCMEAPGAGVRWAQGLVRDEAQRHIYTHTKSNIYLTTVANVSADPCLVDFTIQDTADDVYSRVGLQGIDSLFQVSTFIPDNCQKGYVDRQSACQGRTAIDRWDTVSNMGIWKASPFFVDDL